MRFPERSVNLPSGCGALSAALGGGRLKTATHRPIVITGRVCTSRFAILFASSFMLRTSFLPTPSCGFYVTHGAWMENDSSIKTW